MWSMGRIHGRSSDNRSYEILTENGPVISRNQIHMWETNVVFRECVPISISITDLVNGAGKAESVMAPESSSVPNNKPATTSPCVMSTKCSIGSNDSCQDIVSKLYVCNKQTTTLIIM